MRVARTVQLVVSLTLAVAAVGAPKEKEAELLASLKKQVETRFPDAHVVDVQPAKIPGMYEVFTGDSIAYVDRSGDYMIVGSMLDTRTRADLSAQRLTERNGIDFASLPLDRAIKTVKGNGARKLAVFSDPECPFCQALEKELASLTDYTMYTFLYPIKDLHPNAVAKAQAIWCKPDRSQAWSQWMLLKKDPEPAAAPCDADPVNDTVALGRKLRITGTPTLYLADGRRLEGMQEAPKLETLLTEASSAALKTAAASH